MATFFFICRLLMSVAQITFCIPFNAVLSSGQTPLILGNVKYVIIFEREYNNNISNIYLSVRLERNIFGY